jgi:ATP-dependent helicase/nuclease subunit A
MIADQKIREQVLNVTQSFLVQAPAGSGKTSLLVQRFLSLLAVVEHAPEEILALTFTRKAAAEMRDRIIAALHLGMQTARPDSDYQLKIWLLAKQVLLRDQQAGWDLLDNPTRLKIQTLDALCASITRQMPILSQFGAQPQIENRPEALYAKAVEQLLHDTGHTVAWQLELNSLLAYLDNDRNKVKKLLMSMLATRDQWLSEIMNGASQADLRASLERSLELVVAESIEQLCSAIPEELDFALLPEIDSDNIEDWITISNILLTKDGAWRRKITEREGFPAPSSSKNKHEKEMLKARKDAMILMLEKLSAHDQFKSNLLHMRILPPITYNEQQWQIINALLVVLRVLAAQLITVFKDYGQLDFTGVTLAALHALGVQDPPTDLALALDCKIQHILVDEFQDTSNTQFKLLEKLVANWQPYDGKTLFLVGDPMQSIYRFRKAEVGLFLQTKQTGIMNIKPVFAQLRVNFRSVPAIVTWINNLFSSSFPKQDDMTFGSISYMPAQAAITEVNQAPVLQCLAVAQQNEIANIIAIIQQHKISDPTKTIAILVRAKSHLAGLLPALRTANIPYQGIELESLKQRPLIQDLLSLTRALLHLEDRIAWLAILRAPWCGLTLADMLLVAESGLPIWQSLNQIEIMQKLSTDGKLRISRLVKVIEVSLAQRGRQSIDIQVQKLWHSIGGMHCISDQSNLHEAEMYFNLLTAFAHDQDIYSPGYLEQKLDQLFLQPALIDSNAVQIMTMHKAKGLEFDIVILPSLGKKTRRDTQKLLLAEIRPYPEAHLLLAPIKAATEQNDAIYNYLAWSEVRRQEFEELRLLYVAMTRARKNIYCLADVQDKEPAGDSLIAKIWPAISQEFVSASADQIAIADARNVTIQRLPSDWYEQNLYIAPQVTTTEAHLEILQEDWLRLVGIVVHRIFYRLASDGLEKWPQEQILLQQPVWLQHLRQLGIPKDYLEQGLKLISRAVINTINDPLGQTILSNQHQESYAEWSLTVRSGVGFKQVILDRAFMDQNNQFWIVDYKTLHDETEITNAIERYTQQLNKYVVAVKKIKPNAAIVAGLYFPLQTRWVVIHRPLPNIEKLNFENMNFRK